DEVLGRLEVLGQPAPAWAVTWVGSKSASLKEVKRNVVALAFLDPSDSGSAEVAATLETLRQEHRTRGLASVAIVSAPEASEEAAAADVEAWAGEHGATYPVGVDKQGRATFDLYKGEQIPWVALIGRDGVVHYLGAYSKTEFDGKLATLLAAER
ncbi:MAG: redoxin domain-containing protein, partial [FCB group bacterium]|nr:redoxin domain-containing protein [FCB group bacterium]